MKATNKTLTANGAAASPKQFGKNNNKYLRHYFNLGIFMLLLLLANGSELR